jgi:hypothetical protein
MKKKMQAGGMAGNRMMPMTSMPEMAKKGAKVTKAKNGMSKKSLAAVAPPKDKITAADTLTLKIKNSKSKAMYGKTMKAKSGAKMSMKKMMSGGKCKNGC